MISATKLGWVAAIIDLKGHIIRKKNKTRKTPQLVLMVETKNFPVIRELCALTGTKVEAIESREAKDFMRRACVEHCPDQHVHMNENWQMPAIARWTLTGVGAAVVLWNIMPYMTTDQGWREFIDEALTNGAWTGQGSGMVKSAIRRLADLGWELPPMVLEELIPREDAEPKQLALTAGISQ